MKRIVVDTNVLVSGFAAATTRRTPTGQLIAQWAIGEFDLVSSPDIQAELARTLDKPYFLSHRHRLLIEELAARYVASAEFVTPDRIITGVASHPEDDRILSLTVSARADYLVTGDRQLRALGAIEQIPIVSAAEFLAILTGDDPTT